MTKRQQDLLQVFMLVLAAGLLPLAILLNRGWAFTPLIGFLAWLVRRWLPPNRNARRPELPASANASSIGLAHVENCRALKGDAP